MAAEILANAAELNLSVTEYATLLLARETARPIPWWVEERLVGGRPAAVGCCGQAARSALGSPAAAVDVGSGAPTRRSSTGSDRSVSAFRTTSPMT